MKHSLIINGSWKSEIRELGERKRELIEGEKEWSSTKRRNEEEEEENTQCVWERERELERESSEEGVTDTLSGCNYNWTGEREREKCDVETNKEKKV